MALKACMGTMDQFSVSDRPREGLGGPNGPLLYYLNMPIFRVPEVMFQPSMLGMEQAGLAEVIEFILKKYPPEIQNNLVQVGFVASVT